MTYRAIELLGLTGIDIVVRLHKFANKVYGETKQAGSRFYIDLYLGPDTPQEVRDRVILHELIHVQQLVSGRLRFDGSAWVWTGDFYESAEPWEAEAERLAEEYLTNLNPDAEPPELEE